MSRSPHARFAPPRIALALPFLASVAIWSPACGGGGQPVAPRLIAGGGVGDGPIAGLLNIYVTDVDTRAPIAAANVRVGASAAASPCTALTDSTGLAVMNAESCPALRGKQTLTAWAQGHVPSTLIGVNGANVTVTIRATAPAPVETATVTGTITGWDGLAAPATGHQTLGIVGYSQTRDLGDRANELPQGTRPITVTGVGSVGTINVQANVCVRNAAVSDCSWRLTTRTGAQAHYAVVLDQDTKGTPNDDSDDTFTAIGWAVKTGLNFAAGQNASGESLALLGDTEMRTLTVTMTSPPPGLDDVAGFPMIDLGSDGRVPITSPALDLTVTSTRVPALTGALAAASYDLLARAQDAKDKAQPSTLTWLHRVDAAATISVAGWLTPPVGLSAAGGVYSFAPVPGATLHSADLKTTADATVWSVTIFDDTTSFTLPGLTPDPVPTGMVRFDVSALRIPGVGLQDVSFDDAREKITGLSSDEITFTR